MIHSFRYIEPTGEYSGHYSTPYRDVQLAHLQSVTTVNYGLPTAPERSTFQLSVTSNSLQTPPALTKQDMLQW